MKMEKKKNKKAKRKRDVMKDHDKKLAFMITRV
jgi:hypothetical protein